MSTAIRLATKQSSVSSSCASLVGDRYLRTARKEVGAVCPTRTFTTTPTTAPNSNSVETAGVVATRDNYDPSNGNRCRHGSDSNTGRANTGVTVNGTSSPRAITPAPAIPSIVPSCPVTAPPTPVPAPPAPVASQVSPTPYVIKSPPSGIGYPFLAGSTTLGPLKFTITLDCGMSSHFVDNSLIGDIESWMKDIVKLDPPATIVITNHSTLSGVSMGTLTIRVTDAQNFLPDMLLPAINVPGFFRHLFSGGTAALKGLNTVIAKESYLDVGQFKIPLRKDAKCPFFLFSFFLSSHL